MINESPPENSVESSTRSLCTIDMHMVVLGRSLRTWWCYEEEQDPQEDGQSRNAQHALQ